MAEQVDSRPEAVESLTREIEHRGREVQTDELRLRQKLEHGLCNEARTDPEIEHGSVGDIRRGE